MLTNTEDKEIVESEPVENDKEDKKSEGKGEDKEKKGDKEKKKSKAKKDKNDPARFAGAGVNFKAKLIGIESVPEARGDKMCQEAIQKLKSMVKSAGEHKHKITVNVGLEGLKILDEKSGSIIHHHAVHKISFISRDVSDGRAFGYVYGSGDGNHDFFGIKTDKAAEGLVLTLRDLFQVVFEMKKREVEEAKRHREEETKRKEEAGEHKPSETAESAYDTQSGSGESGEASAPQTKKPEEEEERGGIGNLLDLESELAVIEQGIQQLTAFGESSPASSSNIWVDTSTEPWRGSQSSGISTPTSATSVPPTPQFPVTFNSPTAVPGPAFPGAQTSAQNDPFLVQQPAFPMLAPPGGAFPQQPLVVAQAQNSANPFGGDPFTPSPTVVPPRVSPQSSSQSFGTPPTFPAFGATQQQTPSPRPAGGTSPATIKFQQDPFKDDPFFNQPMPGDPNDRYAALSMLDNSGQASPRGSSDELENMARNASGGSLGSARVPSTGSLGMARVASTGSLGMIRNASAGSLSSTEQSMSPFATGILTGQPLMPQPVQQLETPKSTTPPAATSTGPFADLAFTSSKAYITKADFFKDAPAKPTLGQLAGEGSKPSVPVAADPFSPQAPTHNMGFGGVPNGNTSQMPQMSAPQPSIGNPFVTTQWPQQ